LLISSKQAHYSRKCRPWSSTPRPDDGSIRRSVESGRLREIWAEPSIADVSDEKHFFTVHPIRIAVSSIG
jgi:hypothetical protein